MRRTLNVVRLQLINKNTFIWVPLIVLASAVVVSVIVYVLIPVDTPKYGGGSQAPLWIYLAVGMSAMTSTFPFSQAISITRREFFLGSMAAAAMSSALMGLLFIIGGGIELLTHGYGVNGWVFHLPWVWEAGPIGAFTVYFTLALLFFVIGFTGVTIFKRWGPITLTLVGVGLGVILAGLALLIARLDQWGQVFAGIMHLGAFGLALWGLVAVAVLMVVSFLTIRRAIP
ncbi:MAG: hypothetical protein LBU78_10425 [Microbacterium sp.]|jgi:hypothetical protein|nr:hypothetical protein [Microbacterium sp.]